MKLAHHVKISVFGHESNESEEEIDRLPNLLKSFFPFEIPVNKKVLEGFDNKKILVFSVDLSKQADIKKFLQFLVSRLSEDQKELLINQSDSRIDDDIHFFVRFDKSKLISENRLWITDKGNCFHVDLTLAAFPKSKEEGLKTLKTILHQN